jgi:hypothetical protein
MKSYVDCMDEISAEELYEGLLVHGMFSSKLPPIFSAESFGEYCKVMTQEFQKRGYDYVVFDTMRNVNIPRSLGIPNPMAYQKLCASVKEYWGDIQAHFREFCGGQTYKVSRTHVRKSKGRKSLFDMSYDNWKVDGAPEAELLVGAKYIVHADISACFPSVYTHALCWALDGKEKAKDERQDGRYNSLDEACRKVKNGETHGLLIGPHVSNLLAEIILVVVDKELGKEWKYVRHIDDYTCYVRTRDDAERFIRTLTAELRKFDLLINHKKTIVEALPVPLIKEWKRQLSVYSLITSYGKTSYREASSYLDLAVKLMKENNANAAVLNYAIKTLSGQQLTDSARWLCVKQTMHLALVYPYLVPLLEEYVFKPYSVSDEEVADFAKLMYEIGVETGNVEQCCYSIYYSLKRSFCIPQVKLEHIMDSDNCVFKLLGWLYYKRYGTKCERRGLKGHAVDLYQKDMDRNWLFVFEALSVGDLTGDWKLMKRGKVSFLIDEFRPG